MSVARIPFSPGDVSAIRQLVGAMLFLLVVNFVVGALVLGTGCISSVIVPASFQAHPAAGVGALLIAGSSVLYGLGMIGQGVLLVQARRALDAIVQTDAQDQAYLAIVFARLKIFFALEGLLFVIFIGTQLGGTLMQLFGAVAMMQDGFPGVGQ